MKNIFNTKKQNETNAVPAPRTFGPTKKKKNTYILDMHNALYDAEMFSWCDDTPMQIVMKNGQYASDANQGFAELTPFPNPMTTDMIQVYSITKPVMGKLAATVVEYLDKDTGEPVLMVFPHTTRVVLKNQQEDAQQALARLNHATRRDLFRQLKMRDKFIKQIMQQRTK